MLSPPPGHSPRSRPPLRWPVVAGLAAVLLLGTLLRVWGAGAGAPFRMGVDEPVIVSNALRMIKTGDFNPHFFDYGGLTLYLHAAVGTVAFVAGAMDGRWSHLDAIWEGDLLVAGRLATATFSALTILLVFRIGLRWSPSVALVAALVMAVLPAHVREAHFILTDTPLTFFITLALLLSIRAAEQQTIPAILAAGVAVGLATAVKYNGVLALVLPLFVAITWPRGRRLTGVSAAIAASAATFLICAPYTILDLPAFLNGMAFLMQSYNQHRPLPEAMANYIAYLRNWFAWPGVLPVSLGYLALLLTAAGFATMLAGARAGSQRIAAILVVGFSGFYFWFISTQALQYGRYLMPIGPMISVGLAIAIVAVFSRAGRTPVRRAVLFAPLALIVALPAASAISWNQNHNLTTTTEQAAQWIVSHAAAGDRVAIEASLTHLPPQFPVTRTNSLVARTVEQYQADAITYLVATSALSDRYYADPATYADALAAHRTLLALTTPVATFVPETRHPGPTITVLRVPPPADTTAP